MNTQARPTALITGASSGIGATYADRLARRGHDLLLVARDAQRLQVLAERLRSAYGIAVEVMPADLTQKTDVRKVEQRLREDAAIGLLVNNAGVSMNGTLAQADLEYAEQMIELNVIALTRLAAAAAANFSAVGRGGIINLGSVVALAPEMFNAVYSATKAYVLSLSQTLAAELRSVNVQVQAVLPGLTRTEIFERSGTDASLLPPSMIMAVEELVDAALAGFDQQELVTIPSLPDAADWEAFVAARAVLGPNLSHNQAAARYK